MLLVLNYCLLPRQALSVDNSGGIESGVGPEALLPAAGPEPGAIRAARRQFSDTWGDIDRLLAEQQDIVAYPDAQDLAGPQGTPAIDDTYIGNKWGPPWMKPSHITVGKMRSVVATENDVTGTPPRVNRIWASLAHPVDDFYALLQFPSPLQYRFT